MKAFPLRGRCHGSAVTDEVKSLQEPLFSVLNKVFRSANAPLVQRGDAPQGQGGLVASPALPFSVTHPKKTCPT